MEEGGLQSGHTSSIRHPPPQERAADKKPPGGGKITEGDEKGSKKDKSRLEG